MEHTNMTLLRAGVCKNIWMRILLGVSGSQYPPKSFQRTTLTLRKRFQVASWCDVTRTTTLLEHSKPQHTIHHLKSGRSIMLCIWQSEMLDCLREMQTNKQFNFEHFALLTEYESKLPTSSFIGSIPIQILLSFTQTNLVCVYNPSFYQLYTDIHMLNVCIHTLIYGSILFRNMPFYLAVCNCLLTFLSHSVINAITILVTNRYHSLFKK